MPLPPESRFRYDRQPGIDPVKPLYDLYGAEFHGDGQAELGALA